MHRKALFHSVTARMLLRRCTSQLLLPPPLAAAAASFPDALIGEAVQHAAGTCKAALAVPRPLLQPGRPSAAVAPLRQIMLCWTCSARCLNCDAPHLLELRLLQDHASRGWVRVQQRRGSKGSESRCPLHAAGLACAGQGSRVVMSRAVWLPQR
jgi:hypothetical protein